MKISIIPRWNAIPYLEQIFFSDPSFQWSWRWYGLGYGHESTDAQTNEVRSDFVVTPYWFFITPLTLISAFLLLTKPRKSTQKKITEPIRIEGT